MPVTIIAEVAQGYEGKPELARLLAKAAAGSGADAVKFQCIYADELAVPAYQHYDLFRQLEMSHDVWREIADIVKQANKEFYFDIFGEQSLTLAKDIGIDGVKIHSTDFFNTDLIHLALEAFSKVLVSMGGISAEEMEEFIRRYNIYQHLGVCFMYGYQAEPTPLEKNNINRLGALRQRFPQIKLGFMDHADGSSDEAQTLSLLALSFGVDYIEKHISLDRALALEDYVSALTPSEFKIFVKRIRRHEASMGSAELVLTESEREYRNKVLKAAVANRNLKKNEKIEKDSIALKRPASSSISSLYRKEDVIGRVLDVDVEKYALITKDMLL